MRTAHARRVLLRELDEAYGDFKATANLFEATFFRDLLGEFLVGVNDDTDEETTADSLPVLQTAFERVVGQRSQDGAGRRAIVSVPLNILPDVEQFITWRTAQAEEK